MIKLENNWEIDSDGMQYILHQFTGNTDKEGRKVYRDTTYHVSVEKALESLIRKKQRETVAENEMSLQEAIKCFREINEELERQCKVGG